MTKNNKNKNKKQEKTTKQTTIKKIKKIKAKSVFKPVDTRKDVNVFKLAGTRRGREQRR